MSRAWVWAEIAYGVLNQPTNATEMLIKGCQLDPALAFPVPALALTREREEGVGSAKYHAAKLECGHWGDSREQTLKASYPQWACQDEYDTTSEGFKLLLPTCLQKTSLRFRERHFSPRFTTNAFLGDRIKIGNIPVTPLCHSPQSQADPTRSQKLFISSSGSEHTYSYVGPEKEKPVTAGKTSPENFSTNSTMTDIIAAYFTLGPTTWLSYHGTVSAALAPVNDERHASNTETPDTRINTEQPLRDTQ
ncbi:uncharacterized protein VDAG_07605 [Verticillium dahliae VdLs.17]|uniref:Uncharacterized protein n=1 Tax=Verticillium dahliae (strain VdLs.17 / ATCC MYA-4575 / FGSC 10137) TaxID=498257 RepID=G2XC27_VERDV|nr:uncharacterized protein VDAG_07605 [Verticillium dahliae VdLs.17]EGY16441.1 hypothetical protein VDAG_07605 [Verticillium dahliae VdLs.17]